MREKNTGALVKLVRSISMPVGMSRPVVGHLIINIPTVSPRCLHGDAFLRIFRPAPLADELFSAKEQHRCRPGMLVRYQFQLYEWRQSLLDNTPLRVAS